MVDTESLFAAVAGIQDLEVLKQEAAEKKFPDNELLQRLNTVLTDTQHCQKTSTDLLSNPQTRLLTHTHTHLPKCHSHLLHTQQTLRRTQTRRQ